jgi:hypothetical protein
MSLLIDRVARVVPIGLGVLTLVSLVPLIVWDTSPRLFPAAAHDILAAVPLVSIAIAYVVHKGRHRPAPAELAKALLLAFAFLFWAANQLWPQHGSATLFNDIAIAGFVLDLFLVIAQRSPATAPLAGG